jgi:NAD(P)H-nitrite reductase large subunit
MLDSLTRWELQGVSMEVWSRTKVTAICVTPDGDGYAARGITCRFGEHVVRIDRTRKVVEGQNGAVPYDKLVIATGSAPSLIPVPATDLPRVITSRDLDDITAMITTAADTGGKAVVIGGGLLGLEGAAGLAGCGMDVTVVHLMRHLMERQLDPVAGMDVQETERLIVVASEREAIDATVAVVRLYRENARYLDRVDKWTGKVGIDRGRDHWPVMTRTGLSAKPSAHLAQPFFGGAPRRCVRADARDRENRALGPD